MYIKSLYKNIVLNINEFNKKKQFTEIEIKQMLSIRSFIYQYGSMEIIRAMIDSKYFVPNPYEIQELALSNNENIFELMKELQAKYNLQMGNAIYTAAGKGQNLTLINNLFDNNHWGYRALSYALDSKQYKAIQLIFLKFVTIFSANETIKFDDFKDYFLQGIISPDPEIRAIFYPILSKKLMFGDQKFFEFTEAKILEYFQDPSDKILKILQDQYLKPAKINNYFHKNFNSDLYKSLTKFLPEYTSWQLAFLYDNMNDCLEFLESRINIAKNQNLELEIFGMRLVNKRFNIGSIVNQDPLLHNILDSKEWQNHAWGKLLLKYPSKLIPLFRYISQIEDYLFAIQDKALYQINEPYEVLKKKLFAEIKKEKYEIFKNKYSEIKCTANLNRTNRIPHIISSLQKNILSNNSIEQENYITKYKQRMESYNTIFIENLIEANLKNLAEHKLNSIMINNRKNVDPHFAKLSIYQQIQTVQEERNKCDLKYKTYDQLLKISIQISYEKLYSPAHLKVAEISVALGLTKNEYQDVLNIINESNKTFSNIPEVLIDGNLIGYPKYYLAKLPDQDFKALFMGEIVDHFIRQVLN